MELKNSKGMTAIVYTKYGAIFVPECTEIRNFTIINHDNKCFKEILIKFRFKNSEIYGYMDSNKIITTLQRNKL
jgi:hypothetical protein